MRQAPQSRFSARIACLASAGLPVFPLLGGVAHVLIVEHATCPEHGELIHPAEASRAATAPKARERSVAVADSTGGAASHDHCLLSRTVRSTDSSSVPVDVSPLPECAIALASPRELPPALFPAVYLIAPKTSPPA